MSLLALLAATAGGDGPTPPTDPRPEPADETIAAIRPDGRRIGLLTVAPTGGDYTTLKDAATAAAAIQTAKMSAESAPTKTPNYRVDILVEPGHYVGDFTVPAWTAWYATDPTRGATTLTHTVGGPSPSLGTINTLGGIYWEGIDLTRAVDAPGVDPKYPIHASSVGGTSIFARCTLDNKDSASPGGTTAYGQDGSDGGYALLYDCDLTPGGTNAHGWAELTIPQTQVYVNCRTPGALSWSDLGAGIADELWVQGCTAESVACAGAATVLHLAGSTISGAVTAGGTQDAATGWPVPAGGLSPRDRAHYGM